MVFANVLILSAFMASLPAGAHPVLLSQLQQSQSSEQPPAAATPTSPPASTAPKPCLAPGAVSANQTNCTPVTRKKKKHHAAAPAANSDSSNSTKVVRNGSTSEPIVAISPAETQQQAIQELSTTNQLLTNADANLRQLSRRQLTEDEEGTVKQIQVYIQQARAAVKNGEAQRAYILANKADMLSTDLVRPRQ
jgi:hypothetical protein